MTEVTTEVITGLVALKLALALRFWFALWNADLQHFIKLGNSVSLTFSPLSDASPALHKSYFQKVSNLFSFCQIQLMPIKHRSLFTVSLTQ